MSSLWQVQLAIYARLSADTALQAAGVEVYDQVPQGAPRPYVVIGEKTEAPVGAFGHIGYADTITLHVWSDYDGDIEILQILDLLDSALLIPVTIGGHMTARLRRDFTATLREDDARHLVTRWRVHTFAVA